MRFNKIIKSEHYSDSNGMIIVEINSYTFMDEVIRTDVLCS